MNTNIYRRRHLDTRLDIRIYTTLATLTTYRLPSSQGNMTGLATPVKVFALLVLVTAYVYLFGWASLARFMEGEIVISRKIYRSEAIKPPGLSEDSFL